MHWVEGNLIHSKLIAFKMGGGGSNFTEGAGLGSLGSDWIQFEGNWQPSL